MANVRYFLPPRREQSIGLPSGTQFADAEGAVTVASGSADEAALQKLGAIQAGAKPVTALITPGQGMALPLNQVVQNVGRVYPAPARLDNTVIGIGDSIMRAQGINNSVCSFLEYAAIASNGAMKVVDNKGINGNKTSDILARITDVTSSYARWVVIMEAANDALQGVSVSAHRTNMIGIITAILAAGQTPIIVGAPPVNNYNTWQYNACDQELARQYGLLYINLWAACVADGKWFDTTFSMDGVHPYPKAGNKGGSTMWAQLSKYFTGSPDLTWTNTDPDGILSNALFLTTGGANGAPAGWTGAANVTHALEAGTGDVVGNWWKQTATGITGWAVSSRTGIALPSGWQGGDAVRLSCRVRTVGVEANGGAGNGAYPMSGKMGVYISFNWGGVTDKLIIRGVEADVNGVISIDGIIPAATTGTSSIQVVVYQTATVSGEVSIAQLQMHNLSRAGRM